MHKLPEVLKEIDEVNNQDPRTIKTTDGTHMPLEYLYSIRMTDMLQHYDPEAGELLQIAARGQHIRRWAIPRNDFPMGRKGYLQWRTKLKRMHAEHLAEIMRRYGYDDGAIQKISVLVNKQQLKTDEDSQKLEDVVCLVFLKHYFDDFAKEHTEDKLIDILKKTWKKMSDKGRTMALNLDLSERARQLVALAIRPSG